MLLRFTPTPNPSPQGEGNLLATGSRLARARRSRTQWPTMKFTLSWLKDHLDTSAPVAELAEKLALIGLDVESVDDPAAKLKAFTIARVHRGQAPPQRRQAAGVQGRHRLRRGGGRMRRAQRQDRHDRRVRAHGQLHPRHQDHARGQARARRRLAGHAGVGARAGAVRRPRGHHRAGARDGEQARPALRRRAGPRRSRHRGEAHAQPARLHRRARHRPRPGRRRPRHAEARAQNRATSRAASTAPSTSSSTSRKTRATPAPASPAATSRA